MAKNIFKLFLIIIFVIGTLNFAYANGAPFIGENDAKESAQSYLNSHNLSYTAVIHGWDDCHVKAIDTKTGKVKWIPLSIAEEDAINGTCRYELFDGVPFWIVQIKDKNEKNVGKIYVDVNDGEVLKVIINDKVLKDIINQTYPVNEDAYNSTNETLSESAINENLSETYEYSDVITDLIGTIYPITQISQGLFGSNLVVSVIILIIMICLTITE